MTKRFPITKYWFLGLCVFFGLQFDEGFALAQPILKDSYQGIGQAQAKNENYVEARGKALIYAMKDAMVKVFKDLMDEEKFATNQGELKKIIRRASRYVKSYRYLESQDHIENKTSEVVLQVRFFSGAVNQALVGLGITAGPISEHKVVVLIKENSFTSAPISSFWDIVPISETQLSQNFLESGVEIINRDQIRNTIPEAVALGAIKGNTEDIRNIGLKAGADVVIVGTTISKLKINKVTGIKVVQVNISAKAVSMVDSFLIAAKSDFTIVKSENELLAELEAFDTTSEKLADFLLPSLYRYWEKGIQASDQKVTNAPPIPMADM
tara:strand:- start:549 stop:1523 length:975 start_codon:yes stop_codon:yes gene_type:complete